VSHACPNETENNRENEEQTFIGNKNQSGFEVITAVKSVSEEGTAFIFKESQFRGSQSKKVN
jgi:hypothetical protein